MVAHAKERSGKSERYGKSYYRGSRYGGSQMWREPDLSRLALQVYVPRAEYPVVDAYVCRDHRSTQHTFKVHLGVPPAIKIGVSH